MPIARKVATNLLATMWMMERDALNNTMLKIAGGFHPPSVMADMRHQLSTITSILNYCETIVPKPKDEIIAKDYGEMMEKIKLK